MKFSLRFSLAILLCLSGITLLTRRPPGFTLSGTAAVTASLMSSVSESLSIFSSGGVYCLCCMVLFLFALDLRLLPERFFLDVFFLDVFFFDDVDFFFFFFDEEVFFDFFFDVCVVLAFDFLGAVSEAVPNAQAISSVQMMA